MQLQQDQFVGDFDHVQVLVGVVIQSMMESRGPFQPGQPGTHQRINTIQRVSSPSW
jgi:hypothetical protein